VRFPPKRVSISQTSVYLGLDASLCNFGICSIKVNHETKAWSVLDSTTLKLKTSGVQRLDTLIQTVKSRASCHGVGTVFREDYAFAQRSSSDTSLKELGGALLYALYQAGITTKYVPLSAVKKFVTGKGNAQKAVMLKEVFRRFSVDAQDEHQADAFGVAALAAEVHNPGTFQGLTKEQRHAAATCQIRIFT
jgi:crossover junction endodeoxyribonuclease RuvC